MNRGCINPLREEFRKIFQRNSCPEPARRGGCILYDAQPGSENEAPVVLVSSPSSCPTCEAAGQAPSFSVRVQNARDCAVVIRTADPNLETIQIGTAAPC